MSNVKDTLSERGNRYGDFADYSRVSRSIQREFQSHPGWDSLDDTKKEGLSMIARKIARILNGDPEYKDNWHDIAGYAALVEERCK